MPSRDIHNTFTFGESPDGKFADDSQEAKEGLCIPESVEIADEISGHFCLKCQVLTSLSFNGRRS